MILSLLFILVGSLVLISTVIMTIWFKTNRILNSYLIFISVVLCFYLIIFGLKHGHFLNLIGFGNLSYSQVILVLTPAVYLFFEKLINDIKIPEKKDVFYFILPFFGFPFLSTKSFANFLVPSVLVLVLFLLYTFFFLLKSHQLLKKNVWSSYKNKTCKTIVANWASFIFKMFVLVVLHFLISESCHVFKVISSIDTFLEVLFLVIFMIGYIEVISTPELLYGSPCLNKINSTENISKIFKISVWELDFDSTNISKKDVALNIKITDNIAIYINEIEKATIDEFIFRKKDCSIEDLAISSGIPKYYLEYIFRNHCFLSFSDYKRLVRIYDAMLLINEGYLKNNTLHSLCDFVGFSSYNPFFIYFKQITGLTPFDFYKYKKGRLPSLEFSKETKFKLV